MTETTPVPEAEKSHTFKSMAQDKTIKRADAMQIQYPNLYVEEGFNLRDESEDFQKSIEDLADYIVAGGIYPPLEVRIRPEGGVYIVDGHRRHKAIGIAIARGAPIEWIDIRRFVGNDADRTARIITSAEGRPLSLLEISRGYKRLSAFGMTTSEIAKLVTKTRPHVENLLLLANAPIGVQIKVRDNVVSASVAIDLLRQHGDKADKVLDKAQEQAKSEGKTRVTDKTINGRTIPQADIKRIMANVNDVFKGMTEEAKAELKSAYSANDGKRMISVPAWALLGLRDAQKIAAGPDDE